MWRNIENPADQNILKNFFYKWSKTADQNKQWQLNQLEKKTNIWYNIEKTADQHTFLVQLLGKTKIVLVKKQRIGTQIAIY